MHSSRLSQLLKGTAIGLFLLWTVMPIVFMISSSLKGTGDIFTLPEYGDWWGVIKFLFFFDASLVQFEEIFVKGPFFKHLLTSILATGLSVLISVPVGLAAAYALSRARIRGKKHLYFWVITTRMAPPIAVMIPLYVLWQTFGVLHSLAGLVLAYITFNLPFSIWLMRGFIDAIPRELEEAAYVDGKSRFGAFLDIVFPLIRPGVGATVILCSMFAWNDYLFALILGGRGAKTLPIGIGELASATSILWGQIMAGGLVMIIPMVILGLVIRKSLVTGLTMGAMRG